MTALSATDDALSPDGIAGDARLAARITRAASTQSYITIRLLADRDRAADAYRAYAYFRWVDDVIDAPTRTVDDPADFLRRQQALLDAGYRGKMPTDLRPEEQLLAELIRGDDEPESGLRVYLTNMMAVMAFDQARRGLPIAGAALDDYSGLLATAVMEALLHFIDHGSGAPAGEGRYLAVRAAHIIHMLRDMVEDCAVGYFNAPAEFLAAGGTACPDLSDPAFRAWVAGRVALAHDYFRQGRAFIAQLENRRRRLAGYAYIARFEWMARLIERDGYWLRATYPERKSARAGLWMAGKMVGIVKE